jgi:hypothetical protein
MSQTNKIYTIQGLNINEWIAQNKNYIVDDKLSALLKSIFDKSTGCIKQDPITVSTEIDLIHYNKEIARFRELLGVIGDTPADDQYIRISDAPMAQAGITEISQVTGTEVKAAVTTEGPEVKAADITQGTEVKAVDITQGPEVKAADTTEGTEVTTQGTTVVTTADTTGILPIAAIEKGVTAAGDEELDLEIILEEEIDESKLSEPVKHVSQQVTELEKLINNDFLPVYTELNQDKTKIN